MTYDATLAVVSCALFSALVVLIAYLYRKSLDAERRLDSFIGHHSQAILVVDRKGRAIRANAAFERMVGYDSREVLGKIVYDAPRLSLQEREEIKALHEGALRGESVSGLETVRTTKRGEKLNIVLSVTPFFNYKNEVDSWIAVFADDTARRRDQEEARMSQQVLDAFMQNNTDGIAFLDERGYMKKMNRSVEALFGWTLEELQPLDPMELPMLSPASREAIRSLLLREQVVSGFETEAFTRDGRTLAILISVTPLASASVAYAAVFKDISQLRLAQSTLDRSKTLSMIGQLAAGVAHEIRNPLTSLIGFTKLIESTSDEKHRKYITIMKEEYGRIELILNELLYVAKPNPGRKVRTRVSTIAEYTVALLRTQAVMKSIEIEVVLADDPPLECDENQIKQVLINLLKNAIEAMERSGRITIRSVRHGESRIRVEVADEGNGMSPEQLAKVTEPFFSTKEKGTGLGLMMCANIVSEHNGTLHFESAPGRGTTVLMTLPCLPE